MKTPIWFQNQVKTFEESRFAAMAIMMTAQSCLGSVVVALIEGKQNLPFVAVCAALTMASNAAFIAQMPSKWCLSFFYASIIVNLGLLLAFI